MMKGKYGQERKCAKVAKIFFKMKHKADTYLGL